MNEHQAMELTASSEDNVGHFHKIWMPYVFQNIDVAGVKWAYLPLNRNYKPLGYTSSARVDYQDYAISHGVRFSRDPAGFSMIWVHIDDDAGGRLWLYTDGATSRTDYYRRFERLMTKSVALLAPKGR